VPAIGLLIGRTGVPRAQLRGYADRGQKRAYKTASTYFCDDCLRREASFVICLFLAYALLLPSATEFDDTMTDEKKEEKRITPKDYWMSEPFAEMRRMLDTFRANMEDTLERVLPHKRRCQL